MSTRSLEFPLGVGHTAEVYLWDEGTVLKLFHERYPLDAIEREARIAQRVHGVGLPTPAVIGGIIEVNGRFGLIYERVWGVSMLETLASQPESLLRYANLQAELQVDLHSRTGIEDVPNQHDKLGTTIRSVRILTPDLRSAVLNLLDGLPEGNQLCHGDFHPGNLLLTEDGPVIIDLDGRHARQSSGRCGPQFVADERGPTAGRRSHEQATRSVPRPVSPGLSESLLSTAARRADRV